MINEASIFTIPANVTVTTVDENIVLFSFETGDFYGIGEIGAKVFSMLEEYSNFGAILKQIQSEYDVSEETLRADLIALFGELQKNGLVELADG